MRFVSGFIFGFIAAATIAWASTYDLAVTVRDEVGLAWQHIAEEQNAKHGVNYPKRQYLEWYCRDALTRRAQAWAEQRLLTE